METTEKVNTDVTVNLKIGFDQIWDLITQLTDDAQVQLLDKLQHRLETDGIILIRQDRKQQYEANLTAEQLLNEPDVFINYFDVDEFAAEEEPEISDEEFYESLKEL